MGVNPILCVSNTDRYSFIKKTDDSYDHRRKTMKRQEIRPRHIVFTESFPG